MAAIATPQATFFAEALTVKFADASPFAGRFFSVKPGTRYDKILQGREVDRSENIHAFVERATGHIFKPAGYNKPAEGVRFTDLGTALAAADINGGYLYKR